jgi:hypothetical protein
VIREAARPQPFERLFPVLLAAVPALSGLRRGLVVPGMRPSEVLISALGLWWALRFDWRSLRLSRLDWAVLAYAVTEIVLATTGAVRHGGANATDLRQAFEPLQFVALYVMASRSLSVHAPSLRLYASMVAFGVAVAGTGIAQRVIDSPGHDVFGRLSGASDTNAIMFQEEGALRASGIFDHPHTLAAYLASVVFIVLALAVTYPLWMRRTTLVAALLVPAGIATAATATPSLVTLAASLAALRHRISRRVAVAATASLCITTALLHSTVAHRVTAEQGPRSYSWLPATLSYRIAVWRDDYFPVIGRDWDWLVGYGTGLPPDVRYPYPESMYVESMMRGGLILVATLTVLFGLAIRASMRCLPDGGTATVAATWFLWTSALMLIVGVIEPLFYDVGASHMWWIALGVTAAHQPGITQDRVDGRHLVRRAELAGMQ